MSDVYYIVKSREVAEKAVQVGCEVTEALKIIRRAERARDGAIQTIHEEYIRNVRMQQSVLKKITDQYLPLAVEIARDTAVFKVPMGRDHELLEHDDERVTGLGIQLTWYDPDGERDDKFIATWPDIFALEKHNVRGAS